MDKIIDTRHRKHARKITITFCGNRIFSDIYNEIKMEGYETSTNYIYSSKEKDSCVISMTVKRRSKSFDKYIAFLADKVFCKTIYIYDYVEVDDDYMEVDDDYMEVDDDYVEVDDDYMEVDDDYVEVDDDF